MKFKNQLFWLAALSGLILDRLSKYWIVKNFQEKETLALFPGVLNFTYVLNKGAAFSMFEGAAWLPWLSLAVSLFLIALALFGPIGPRWEQVGFGFLLAGALGNGIDRFVTGKVVDFIQLPFLYMPIFNLRNLNFQWKEFAIFNIADIFINVGIICLLIAIYSPTSKNGRADNNS